MRDVRFDCPITMAANLFLRDHLLSLARNLVGGAQRAYVDATYQTLPFSLRDIDGSVDDAPQQVALQYRIGNTGNFTNVAAG
jgi:hypothetical protein